MKSHANRELLWIARGASGLLIILSVMFFLSYRLFPEGEVHPISTSAIIGLSTAGVGLIGLALAWKWELVGAIIALVAFLTLGIMETTLFRTPLVYIYPGSALLFILLWLKNKDYL